MDGSDFLQDHLRTIASKGKDKAAAEAMSGNRNSENLFLTGIYSKKTRLKRNVAKEDSTHIGSLYPTLS